MSDYVRLLSSRLKPVIKEKPALGGGRFSFYSFHRFYQFFSQVTSIKYVILVITCIVSIISTYLSYRNVDAISVYNHEKKIKSIDERISSSILVNFNLIQSLFVFLNLKKHVDDKIVDSYLSSFDFLKDYKALVSIGLIENKTASDEMHEYFYSLLHHPIPLSWKNHKKRYIDILQESRKPYLFVRNGPLDGGFIFMRQYPKVSPEKIFFSYMRFYPLVNSIAGEVDERFNMQVYLIGENIAEDSQGDSGLEKNLIFVRKDLHFNSLQSQTMKRQFIHHIAGLYWRFEYEVPIDNDLLYYQPLLILGIDILAGFLLFVMTHYLTKRWMRILKESEDLKSSLKKSQSNLQELQRLVHISDFSLIYEQERFSSWNTEVRHFFGIDYQPETIKSFLLLFHEDFRLTIRKALEDLHMNDSVFDIECRYIKEGQPYWVSFRAKNSFDDQGNEVIHGVLMDINDRKTYEERVYALAFKDPVTDLSNRYHLMTEAQRLFDDPDTEYPVVLLFLDLDGFKMINDSLGHTVGDGILRSVSERMLGIVTKNGMVARISGDEFGILLWGVELGNTVEYIADRILGSIRAPIDVSGRTYHLSASIGIAIANEKPVGGLDSILKHADLAMFHGRSKKGKNNYQFYSRDMGDEAAQQLRLAGEIHQAMENGEFVMYYQPRLSLKTLEVTGAEALIRWKHPKHGIITPDKFIHLAEEQGSIVDLGNVVIEESCKGALQWRLRGHSLRVAINLSAKQFISGTLIEDISVILERIGLPMHAIEFEITETSAMQNPNTACLLMQQVKALGIKLSLDDFGTAYSSLAYLKRFPLDYLKLDKSFINGLPANHEDAAITQAVVALAHSLRLGVIAEGVEKKEQAIFLKEQGIDEIQGYVFSRPMPLEDFLVFLEDYRTSSQGDQRFVLRDIL